MKKMPYQVKFVNLNANKIHNMCDPYYAQEFCRLKNYWSNPDLREYVRKRYIDEFNKSIGHYDILEEDILEYGIENPVLVTAGPPRWRNIRDLPPEVKENNSNRLLVCEVIGGSRLLVAQKYNLDVPCLVSDWVGRFNEMSITDEEKILSYFKHKPGSVDFTPNGLTVRAPNYSHLTGIDGYNVRKQSEIRTKIVRKIIEETKLIF